MNSSKTNSKYKELKTYKFVKGLYHRLLNFLRSNVRLRKKIKFLNNLVKDEFVFKSPWGFKIIINPSKIVEREFYLGRFENEVLKLFDKLLKTNDIVFDVGANVGLFSLLAANRLKDKVKVYAFEPSDYPFDKIRRNISLNKFKSINTNNIGLWDHKGFVKFHLCIDEAYNSIGTNPQSEIKSSINIPVTTIDDFCQEKNITKIDILKIDSEGAEFQILNGAKRLISSLSIPIIICEYNREVISGYPYTLLDLENFLRGSNYELFEIKKNRLMTFSSGSSLSSNLVCIQNNNLRQIA